MYAAVPRIRPSPVAGAAGMVVAPEYSVRCIRELREAEVEHLDSAVVLALSDHDVAGLQVAVRDAFLVRGSNGIGDGNRNRQDLGEQAGRLSESLRRGLVLRPAPS